MTDKRILVVDDERDVLDAVCRMLSTRGFRVESACGPEAALEIVSKSKPDLLLTDIMMPGMDGVELAKRIKSRYPDTPVILMTGQGSLDTAIASLELGADAYVMKPLEWDRVISSIQAALG